MERRGGQFLSHRVIRNLDTIARMTRCGNLQEAFSIQAEWFRDTADDYVREFGKLVENQRQDCQQHSAVNSGSSRAVVVAVTVGDMTDEGFSLAAVSMGRRLRRKAVSLPVLMMELAFASWETVGRRSLMIARGRCSSAEYWRMMREKSLATHRSASVLAGSNGTLDWGELIAPWHIRATSNVRRLRRRS